MRYSTNTNIENLDASLIECNIQPVEISKEYGIYIAHNGNLPNLKSNMQRLGLGQYYKNGMSDTYLFKLIWNMKFMKKIKQSGKTCSLEDILEYLKYILMNIVGAYSCVMSFCEPISSISSLSSPSSPSSMNINKNENKTRMSTSESEASDSSFDDFTQSQYKYYLIGFRDRYGYKPLSIGKLISNNNQNNNQELVDNELGFNYCFISESAQLQDKAFYIGDVAPGEIWCSEMNKEPYLLGKISDKTKQNKVNIDNESINGFLCSLEAIYFMKKETLLFNGNTTVNNFRRSLGVELAKQDINTISKLLNPQNPLENYYEARMLLKNRKILFMPESAYSIAQGYSDILGISVCDDLISKVQNIRSFIESTTEAREGKLKRKFAFNDKAIMDLGETEIVLIDDTIVRGNSMKYIIAELYKRNPKLKIHVRIGSPKIIKGCSFGIDLYDDELIATKEPDLASWLNIASVEFLDIQKLKNIFASYNMFSCQYCFGISHKYNTKTLDW